MFEPIKDNIYKPKIGVIGIGGAGCNAITHMIENGLEGVKFYALNTDLQALETSKATYKIQLGPNLTRGLGSGGDPEIGRKAAEESIEQIKEIVAELDMVFIAVGEGGGTGTGASPLVVELLNSLGSLIVAIVTKPFSIEGMIRKRNAEWGIRQLKERVNTLIVIPNDKLLSVAPPGTSIRASFKLADDILYKATKAIANLINKPGIINVDFADVKSVMSYKGNAIIGIGTAKGEERAEEAAYNVISSPLIEDFDIAGAKGVLINITGNENLGLDEVYKAAKVINQVADKDANIILGVTIDNSLEEEINVTLIATGIEEVSHKSSKIEKLIPSSIDELKVPAFIRVERDIQQGSIVDKDDFEIPTFLRKNVLI